MKKMIIAAIFAASASVYAEGSCVDAQGKDIFNEPEVFQVLIENAQSCYEAKKLADACAWGSSLDVSTAGAAYGVCAKELEANKPSKSLNSLLNNMNKMCNKKYAKMDGTLYRSMNAYCQLEAVSWINSLAAEN